MGLVTDYPPVFILLCLLTGAIYAGFLYWKDIRNGFKPWIRRFMAGFRFFSVSIIAFLLLGPLIRMQDKSVERPLVILGIDNSRSMILATDSARVKNTLRQGVESLAASLKSSCDVKIYSFGDKLESGFSGSFNGLQTNISAFFNEAETRFSNRNAAALVLVSDGIYNEGSDPFYASGKITFPVFTVATGDTVARKDALIRKVIVNKTAFKGDRFPVEVMVEMNKCAGSTLRLTLSQGANVLETRDIQATGDRYVLRVPFLLEAKTKGMLRYGLSLSVLDNEANNENNRSGFIIEILDARQRIAVLSQGAHPDIHALLKALEGSSRFETEAFNVYDMPASFDRYDVVILHQLPAVSSVTDLAPVIRSGASLMFILGTQSDINALNKLNAGLSINASRLSFVDAQPALNSDFSLFSMESKDNNLFRELPPLLSPFGTYQYNPSSEVLFYQRINGVATQTPLLLLSRMGANRTAFVTGENLWRWRMAGFLQKGTHEDFDLLIEKIVMFLASREEKSNFRINVNSRIPENQPLEMDAEVFNAAYEMINEPDVNITISDDQGKSYPFLFSRSGKGYHLNAGLFPVGEYTYRATVKVGREVYQKAGNFFIEQVNAESAQLVADHGMLQRIAASHGGEMIYLESLPELSSLIEKRDELKSVAVYAERLKDLIGNPWLFAAILGLLTAEWIFRKREGM